jgi:nucleoside-diphosphate-sugar epimerase
VNVFITGGTGFVGTWMRRKKPDGFHIVYVGKRGYQFDGWHKIPYKYIVHLAPISPIKVIECAKQNNARLLYCSSGIVNYPDVDSEYRRNKVEWEKECLDSGVDVVIARIYAPFGKGMRSGEGKAITTFFENAKHARPLEVWGDGSTVRSYMHGSEMARWMWGILLHGTSGEIYDVGSDRPTTILRLAQRISAITGCEINMVDKPISVPVYLPQNAQKTKDLLGIVK